MFTRAPDATAPNADSAAPAGPPRAGRTNDNADLTLPSRNAAPAMPDTPELPATPTTLAAPPTTEPPAADPLAEAMPDAPPTVADDAPALAPEKGFADVPAQAVALDGPAPVTGPDGLPLATPPQPRPPASPTLSPAACADLLKQHFPALFGGPPKPLKLRIQADINERAPGLFTKAALSAFFRRYTTSTAYLIALGKADSRFDLDGQPAGELSEEHRQLARDELTRRRQVTREREQQAQTQQRAQAQAQHAEQAERQRAQQQERQSRLTLLRDFERTTLTMANFCVLKGLKPEALTPLLAQARQEAAEAPTPPPRFDDQRGPVGPRHDGPRTNPPHPDGLRQDGPRQDARPGGRPQHRPSGRPDGRPDARPQDRPAGPPRGDRRGGKPPGPRGGA